MYKISLIAQPFYFHNLVALNNQVHTYNTRQAETLYVILHKTDWVFSTQVFVAKLWNDLSLNLTNCQTLARFKRKYKTFLFNN